MREKRQGVPWIGGVSQRTQAVTPVIGIVLLFGMVAVASIGLLVVAEPLVSESQSQAEQERIEQSFVELSHAIATTSHNGESGQSLEIEAGEHGALAREDTGNMIVDLDGVRAVNYSIGSIVYEGDDGTTIAYEAGGVFRETGQETQLISTPNIRYDLASGTLSMPIYTITGESHLDSGVVRIDPDGVQPYNEAVAVEGAELTITVKSEYYMGWKSYFESQAGETVVTDYGAIDGDFGFVEATFGYDDIDSAFTTGVAHASKTDPDDENPGGGEQAKLFDNTSHHHLPPLDDLIDELIETKRGHESDDNVDVDRILTDQSLDDPERLEAGTYVVDEIADGDSYEFDLSNGSTTFVVAGDVIVGDDDAITVTNVTDDHALKIYAGGEVLEVNGKVCVEDCTMDGTARHIQFYGPSGMGVDFGPTNDAGTFEGVIYVAAPEDKGWWDGEDGGGVCDDQQVRLQAGDQFYGAIVAYSACAQAGIDFTYDDSLGNGTIDIVPDGYDLPPQINYLNVVERQITIEND